MVLNSKFPPGRWSQVKNPRPEDVALICPLKGGQKPAFRFRECWSIGVLASGSETLRLGESNVMELKEKSLKSGKLLKRSLSWGSCVEYSGRSFFQHSTTPPLHHSVPNKIPAEPFSLTRPRLRPIGPTARKEDVALICPLKGGQKPALRFRECWPPARRPYGSERVMGWN